MNTASVIFAPARVLPAQLVGFLFNPAADVAHSLEHYSEMYNTVWISQNALITGLPDFGRQFAEKTGLALIMHILMSVTVAVQDQRQR